MLGKTRVVTLNQILGRRMMMVENNNESNLFHQSPAFAALSEVLGFNPGQEKTF
jgi:hypothetical protein